MLYGTLRAFLIASRLFFTRLSGYGPRLIMLLYYYDCCFRWETTSWVLRTDKAYVQLLLLQYYTRARLQMDR